jgi:hypothetical protein
MLDIKAVGFIIGIGLLFFIQGSATLPSDAQVIDFGQTVTGSAPGAYYKVDVPSPGTLSVILEEVPPDMLTRIAIINDAGTWLASQDTSTPGETITVRAQADAPGWYWIGILDLNGKTHDTDYAFQVALG